MNNTHALTLPDMKFFLEQYHGTRALEQIQRTRASGSVPAMAFSAGLACATSGGMVAFLVGSAGLAATPIAAIALILAPAFFAYGINKRQIQKRARATLLHVYRDMESVEHAIARKLSEDLVPGRLNDAELLTLMEARHTSQHVENVAQTKFSSGLIPYIREVLPVKVFNEAAKTAWKMEPSDEAARNWLAVDLKSRVLKILKLNVPEYSFI